MAEGADARAAAARVVAGVAAGRSLADSVGPAVASFTDRDRALVQELAFGTVRWRLRLDAMLAHLMRHPPTDGLVHAALAVGLYQILYTRVPEHAAVAATVAAVPDRSRGLVNGVLRTALRKRAEIEAAVAGHEAAVTGHPAWLLEMLRRDWPDHWKAIVEADNIPAPMTLRVNARRTTRDDYLDRLDESGIEARPLVHAPEGVELASSCDVRSLPGFDAGFVSVQDGAAQLAAGLLDVDTGMRVLDACAAPGGKACHALERVAGLSLVAVEADPDRVGRIHENLTRIGSTAEVVLGDATHPSDWWDGGHFDRILVDAPCTGTGVIRRHPDIRHLRRASDVAPMTERQLALLEALWPTLAPGGRLLYATCSMLRAENDGVIDAFLERRPDARVEPIAAAWGLATGHGRQVLPGEDGMDGFHYAGLTWQ